MDHDGTLPEFTARDFAGPNLPECDLIMKGGITSGVVYPYAVLNIATRHRLRSIGGTSAGAVAAALSAAAEYARREGDPAGFIRLQQACAQLPALLPGLFQFDARVAGAKHVLDRLLAPGGAVRALRGLTARALLAGGAGALLALGCAFKLQASLGAGALGAVLAFVLTFLAAAGLLGWRGYGAQLAALFRQLPELGFGACPGRSQPGAPGPAISDWLHDAIQFVAFGKGGRARPLTFGDLAASRGRPAIDLRMVTTNLSMRRPHTLPELGFAAGFEPDRWARYFPGAVMDHLNAVGVPWAHKAGTLAFPQPQDLPVVVAARMSLSFPLLFSTVELHLLDRETPKVIHSLGGVAPSRTVLTHFSDGGLSSNFPVHMFDSPLPTRPTYAFGLEDLDWDPALVTRRVALPMDARHGIGVRIKEITGIAAFGWQVLDSAKDWQDQLASQLPGQRERAARIYLDRDEGGLNLAMPPDLSRNLMEYGAEGGDLFNTEFDMDEHRWRRLIMTYKLLSEYLDDLDRVWGGGAADWFKVYRQQVKSYKGITKAQRTRMADNLDSLLGAWRARKPVNTRTGRFPKVRAALRIVPKF